MGLRFEHAFVVKAPADRVWAYLTDPYRVAPALPGAAITEKVDEQTYAGNITVKVGPVSARYKGTVRFVKLDPASRTADIAAFGQDMSGRGGADMKMTSRLTERAPGETEVSVVSEVSVTGMLAQLGRGMMQDVSDQMLRKFTEAMRAELERPESAASAPAPAVAAAATAAPASPTAPVPAPAPAPPIEVVSFGSQIVGRAAGRALGRPAFWIAVAVVVLAFYWLWSR
jgi:carbon monoxide dehydrogenase subunit G